METWGNPEQYVDALTVNPYLGSDALAPLVQRALALGRGLFVLVKTSNPSAAELQDQPLLSGETVAVQAAKLVASFGEGQVGVSGYAPVGAVVGATYPQDLAALRDWLPHAPFLVPGYGTQGGTAATVMPAFGAGGLGALVAASRSITYAFSSVHVGPAEFARAVAAAAEEANAELRTALARAGKPLT